MHDRFRLAGNNFAQYSVRPARLPVRTGGHLLVSLCCVAPLIGLPIPLRQEATMNLATRLNALAALVSFGFIAAIVLGMV